MKKSLLPLIVLSLVFAGLSGCAGSASSVTNAPSAASSSGAISSNLLPTDYDNALPLELQLVFGTLKLDGTENEVDAKTAQELLPLWKAARSLSGSDTTAPQEVGAIFKQIQETMTPAQIQAIASMKLTRDGTAEIAQEMGLNIGPMGGPGNLTAEQQATVEANRQSGQGFSQGGMPAGMPPDGGAGMPAGGPPAGGFPGGGMPGGSSSSSGSSSNTQSANRARSGPGNAYYDAVIQYLQGKTG